MAGFKKYRVLIICINPYIRVEFQNYLTSHLGAYLQFDTAAPSELKDPAQLLPYQCLLFSSNRVKEEFTLPVPSEISRIVCSRTFNHAYLDQIIQIPPKASVYVVNDDIVTARQSIEEFEESGITQYHFLPWGPESVNPDLSVSYAITIGEPQLVPRHIQNVINIGNRIIDIATINELCTLFHLPASLSNQITRNYISHILKIVKAAGTHYSNYVYTQQLLSAVIASLPLSLCLLDEAGNIQLSNRQFADDWELPVSLASGQPFTAFLAEGTAQPPLLSSGDYQMTNPRGELLRLSVTELSFPGYPDRFLLVSQPAGGEAALPGRSTSTPPTLSFVEQQYSTFQEISTVSDRWNQVLSYAKRLALYDFPLLIQGEAGTQKKQLAAAIHKSSRRRTGPFLNLNRLLAQGNRNLNQILEHANRGTLLVEQVEYLSPEDQALLMLMLQSNPLAQPLSGKRYDIRIIATTSVDLYLLSQEGSFRRDLFFQLNGACIETVPLRQRREDVPLLLEQFFQDLFRDANFPLNRILSDSLSNFLNSYDYPGNVQELLNLAQNLFSRYAAHPLTMADLPAYIRRQLIPQKSASGALEAAVLTVIRDHPRSGRSTIQKALAASGTEISDGKLRGLLKQLADKGLILVHRTRGGCEITEAGSMVLRER